MTQTISGEPVDIRGHTSVIDTQSESHYQLFILRKLVLYDADQLKNVMTNDEREVTK